MKTNNEKSSVPWEEGLESYCATGPLYILPVARTRDRNLVENGGCLNKIVLPDELGPNQLKYSLQENTVHMTHFRVPAWSCGEPCPNWQTDFGSI